MKSQLQRRNRRWLRELGGFALAGSACALAGTAHAQSSVQLYGIVDMWAGVQKLPSQASAAVAAGNGMSTSFWGLGGKEDLGGGLQTVFAIEGFFRPNNGAVGSFDGDPMFSRNAYVGLQSSTYGALTFGRQSSPLYLQSTLFNPFYASFTFSPTVNHLYGGVGTYPAFKTDQGVFGGTAWANAIQFATPDFNGLTGKAIYAFGNTAGENGSRKWSAQMAYTHGAWSISGVYQYLNFSSTPGDLAHFIAGEKSQSVAEIATWYDFGFVKLYGEYTWTGNDRTADSFHVNSYQAGAAVPVGLGRVLASWGYSRNAGGLDLTRQTATIGYDYPLSKRTDLYANYMYDHLTNTSSGYTTGVGLRTRF
ncbi:gram-negative porin family protein [Paraburkholderia xenovorans LB400]|uniref:Outer membrane porin, OmpC family n=1 Tax=Paraburkholderia xenovorans (strain LB400) TaxID=266265 RepID=Q13GV3_PARXL|nr:porin [Paraburkholderia xenovorans]ABE36686.1 outer membrane porin, OmpC family [Paraburkholderia xenovorans LB400]AIP34267.1 gram-negative porin family protein [Paraburkholderia xenovorans LB400]